jgi:hypothetical protein
MEIINTQPFNKLKYIRQLGKFNNNIGEFSLILTHDVWLYGEDMHGPCISAIELTQSCSASTLKS